MHFRRAWPVALVAILAVSGHALAADKLLGITSATDGGSANNQFTGPGTAGATAYTFAVNGTALIDVQCDQPSLIGAGVSGCAAIGACPYAVVNTSDLFPTSCPGNSVYALPDGGTYNGCLLSHQAVDGGPSQCKWYQRQGNEGASRMRNGSGGSGSSSGGYSPPSGQAVATCLTSPTAWFVNGTLGSDSNACTAAGASACATIQGALNKLPICIASAADVNVAPYDAGYLGFRIPTFSLNAPGDAGPVGVHIHGETLVTASGLTGSVVGTADGGSNTFGPVGTMCRLTTDGTLLANELEGRLLELTGGPGSPDVLPIWKNDTADIYLAGACSSAPTNTTTYAVRDPVLVTTAVSLPNVLDGGTTTAGVWSSGGWQQQRNAQVYVKLSNIGAVIPSVSAARFAGTGRVQLVNTRFRATSGASAVGLAISDSADVGCQNSVIESATFAAGVVTANAPGAGLGSSKCFWKGGTSTANSAVTLSGATSGSWSNSIVKASVNTASYNAMDIAGASNMQITTTGFVCTGSNNIGVKAAAGQTSGNPSGVGFSHIGFDNCGTAVSLSGPSHVYQAGAIDLTGTITNLFVLAHGAVWRQTSALNSSGYTNFLTIDGTTLASNTDVTTTYGGYVFSGSTGALFDSVP